MHNNILLPIKIIIGTGNYNNKYINTRHNVGLIFIQYFIKFNKKKIIKEIDLINIKIFILKENNNYIYILISKSYMNNIGDNILSFINKTKIKYEQLLVIYDDIYINIGKSKLKFNGNNSGHKGVENIIKNINSKNFYKLKIGIGKNKNKISNYVLNNFNISEKKTILKNIYNSILGINLLISNKKELAFKIINNK